MGTEVPFGLGAKPSPIDPRDWKIDDLYARLGLVKPTVVPGEYLVPGTEPPVLNQGTKPQCVAYSTASMKMYEDFIDQKQMFGFDENGFFAAIGGGPDGAVVRTAFAEMKNVGYPVLGVGDAADHKIAEYWSVPVTQGDIQAALMSFGPVVCCTAWYNSMFNPASNGELTVVPGSGLGGYHAIKARGFGPLGLRWRQSWGGNWGLAGDCFMPWENLPLISEVWKAVDVIEPPSPPTPVVLKYGGYAGYRGLWMVMFNSCRFRSQPFLTAPIVQVVNEGFEFSNAQTTDQGSLVGGSRRWLGDSTGNRWMSVTLVDLVK